MPFTIEITSDILQSISNIVIAGTALFAWWRFHKPLRLSAMDHLYGRMHDIHKMFLDKPGLRPYFYGSKSRSCSMQGSQRNHDSNASDPVDENEGVTSNSPMGPISASEPTVDELAIASEMIADFFQQAYMEIDYLPKTAKPGWLAYMGHIVCTSQVLEQFVKDNQAWYPSNFFEILKKDEEKRREKIQKNAQGLLMK